MTLLIASLSPHGVVLAADRRTMSTNRKTEQRLVLSDNSEKILFGEGIVIGVVGSSHSALDTGNQALQRWLKDVYSSDDEFLEQMTNLYRFMIDEKYGGFMAVAFTSGTAHCYRYVENNEPDYTKIEPGENGKIKLAGSGSSIAKELLDIIKPPISAFPMQDALDCVTFLISSTHSIMRFRKAKEPSVGLGVTAAIVDRNGAQLVIGPRYHVDDTGLAT